MNFTHSLLISDNDYIYLDINYTKLKNGLLKLVKAITNIYKNNTRK